MNTIYQEIVRAELHDPILNFSERAAINGGQWFSSLSAALRHDILRCAYVVRYRDGDCIASFAEQPHAWFACARGAIRVSSVSMANKQTILAFIEPGAWFGEISILDGDRHTHNAHSHGASSVVCVAKADFKSILAQHGEFRDALLRLHARRIRRLYSMVDDLHLLPLRVRLAKQLMHLLRTYGTPSYSHANEIRIGLSLVQEGIAQMLGVSRQLVNRELKTMERAKVIRIQPRGLVVLDHRALQQMGIPEGG